ncbi:MAG: DNA helicase UvrD [Candidatus Aenigmarchaeota archaeon]|nr:DNA helicase UvrD [Candidatus Aenigmarchaeota archaeon]
MILIADLHIHSKYARACSKSLDIANIEKFARIKGLSLCGTGDFTHPKWYSQLNETLVREEDGIYYTKTDFPFVAQTEISLVYTQGKGRRIHNIVLAPSLEVVKQITDELLKRGRVDYDGRPIFKIPCPEFVEMLRSISPDIEVIPAHVWTPWFSLFGSKSGFDSIQECFQDKTKHIHAIETGISSDPQMNWRLSQLDNINIVSFSDAHAHWPWRLGREATVFELPKITYKNLLGALRTGNGIKETIEFFPEEGKYHFDGHRKCEICFAPKESKNHNLNCPKCNKPLTIGVLHRIETLADRPEGYAPKNRPSFKRLIPLGEIISHAIDTPVGSKKMWVQYQKLIAAFGNEMNVLLDAPAEDIAKASIQRIAEYVVKNREQKIKFFPGYDGEYGTPKFQ